MPLVVPGVARFSLNQSLEGRQVVNVLDYFIDTTGSSMSREEAIDNQAGSIITEWVAKVLSWQVDDLSFNSVSYVDLDEADGITGARLTGGATTLPVSGPSTGSPLPANTAGLVTKTTRSARGQRNGRIFWAGLSETHTSTNNGNELDPTTRGTMQGEWDDFLSNTNELDTLGTAFSSNMVVVHVTTRDTAGNPLTGVGTVVESLDLDTTLATQRRRLRG